LDGPGLGPQKQVPPQKPPEPSANLLKRNICGALTIPSNCARRFTT
jgi:hypothetical protein